MTGSALDVEASSVVFALPGRDPVTLSFEDDVRFIGGRVPSSAIVGQSILVEAAEAAKLSPALTRGMTVVVPVDYLAGSVSLQAIIEALSTHEPAAIVFLAHRDSTFFRNLVGEQRQTRYTPDGENQLYGGMPPIVEVSASALITKLRASSRNATDIPESGATASLPQGTTVRVNLEKRSVAPATAPNVAAVLAGGDPGLGDEFVVVSAHLDHIGITPGLEDSINNGADDNASGVTVLLALAEALGSGQRRLRRSVILLATSGEEHGFWGSRHFIRHPPVSLEKVIANINIDMIGRNSPDTIGVIGFRHSNVAASIDTALAAAEVELAVLRDPWPNQGFFFRSDHISFARAGVPAMYLLDGTHPDYHRPSDEEEKIDYTKISRVGRLVHALVVMTANRNSRPVWNPSSYQAIVDSSIRAKAAPATR